MRMDPVVHFEMAAEDRNRMAEFYTQVFGWKTVQLDGEMGNYVLANTTDTDENGMIKTPGAINGGFYEKMEDATNNAPSVVISVENLQESIERVKSHGGKMHGEVMDIPGIGTYASFIDTEGNRVGMLQPVQMY